MNILVVEMEVVNEKNKKSLMIKMVTRIKLIAPIYGVRGTENERS